MADDVPVTDILCEAMEYLSKLGANLRSRSENLKEKKIRKDKLKNSHAVTKAAQKVLTICELSKKSLDNVESGVKRILSLVDAAQQPSPGEGGKSAKRVIVSRPTHSSTDKDLSENRKEKDLTSPKKVRLSGKKYILRFPRKINVKHYLSVKVLAKSLPKTMLERYPVYINCKLYRNRERKTLREANESNGRKSSVDDNTTSKMKDEGITTKEKESDRRDSKNSNVEDGKLLSKSEDIKDEKKSKTESKYKNDQNRKKSIDSGDSDSEEKTTKSHSNNMSPKRKPHSKSQKHKLDIDEAHSKGKNEKPKMSKHKRILIVHSSSESEEDTNKKKENKESSTANKPTDTVSDEPNEIPTVETISDESSKDRSDEESARNQLEKSRKTKFSEDTSVDIIDKESSKEQPSSNLSTENTVQTDVKQNDSESNETVEQDNQDKEAVKPLIKCVSLNKLLKPDVLDKEEKIIKKVDILDKNPNTKKMQTYVHLNKKGEIKAKFIEMPKTYSSKSHSEKMKDKREKELIEKRKQVVAFKPKKLSVSVIKLPVLTVDFLHKHNLKKITQNGSLVCEIEQMSTVEEICNEKEGFLSSNKNSSTDDKFTNEAKDALLNDSDSENTGSSPKKTKKYASDDDFETEKIKNSLLNDSESDKNEESSQPVCTISENNQSKSHNADLNLLEPMQTNESLNKENEEMRGEKTPEKKKALENDDQDKELAKSSLLHDSNDSESDKNEESSQPVCIISENNKSKSHNADFNLLEPMQTNESLNKDNEEMRGEKTPEKEKAFENDDQEELAKSSLLHDSSGSSSKSPDKQRHKEGSAKKSHRKHIMESMHAKKMLLTYSSSSDTEDEQLKSVIKDMKDTLIKNITKDDDSKKSFKKKLLSSSDSDDDHKQKHIKKKRKISKSRRPSPDVQAEDCENKMVEDVSKSEGEDSTKNDHSISSKASSSSKMGRSKEKAGGSSSQNSDTRDDKDIEGLTNLKSLNKQRRRRDSGSDEVESTSGKGSATSSKKEEMSKLKHFTEEEGLLEAPESSGEEGSAAESEGPDEDLPPITLTGLNGGGLEHLAKDDLLEESESDSSKEKGSDNKKDTDSESDALKSKRRKANTISSDSEAGSSRRKQKEEKISDFEDSEDENSEPVKRSKRKIIGSDSDASAGSSSDGGKKKRRRIKQLESDASGSDSDNDGKKHGRKNIRKVMGKNQLEEATKKAAREEKERVARIAERQKMYNNLEFDETGKPDEVIVDKVVLDFDPSTKEPLIEVDRGLVKKLKPHQANGIKFMWDACFESVKRIKKDRGSGCILAHCMGLGKTLQVVSLTHTLLTHSELTNVNRVLVVCPLSTVLNWVNEFKMWLKFADRDYEVDVYELSKFKQNSERAFQLSSWFSHGGVCVLGYEMFRNLSADNPKKFKKKMLRQFQESLVDPGPDLVVCDEGHLLKNEKTSLSQSMNRVKTRRRIVLTGTPLQNNLKEYYCMVQFVKPNLLGKYNEYLNRFVNPITNGQYTDSTEYDIKVMKRRSHVLHKMLDGAVQRRDYGVLAPFLPPKHEYVLFITLTEVQVKLYQHYLDNYSRRPLAGKSSGFLFPDFQSLQRIWTHPLVLKYNSERYEIMQQKKREREEEEDSEGSLVDFIDDDSTPDETSSEDESDSLSDVSDDSHKKSKKKKAKKDKKKEGKGGQRRGTRANPIELGSDVEPEPQMLEAKNDNPTEWWIPLVTDDEIEDMRNSHKLVLLFEILRQCEAIGDKLLVFSQSLYSLDLIEHFLGKVDEATQEGRIDEKLGGHVGSWSPGIDYFRLDGSTSCENRSIWCKNFNREDNPRARLFLISTRAGGLGINLVAANRVVIFDVSWNPSHDVQSIFRVYRFGQKKPCYIYRFLAMGTMEEKIYERQVTKQAISKRVIDEQQIDRHYAENDLAELYKFEPRPPEPRPVPPLPKDRLFAEMLKEREHVIYKFHEHDSLLENKEEETLSEEERKAAWEDFENEKNRPPPQPFPAWPMHNGMGQLPNLLAQQQQQLAYAALAQMLRKDMPNMTDDNIRAMLPLIYSSNPQMFGGYDYGLMQKLSNMYAQPGMMNPAMMNPGMNVGGAQAGMGGGGTSGLSYEPPWQRQQQQQQQMRMQQLMQQQNQMGAKLYAGGLGSRDPIAMALQQQRAREIMMGGGAGAGAAGAGAGRPRGRPPLQPRAPAAPQDVVNLDSD